MSTIVKILWIRFITLAISGIISFLNYYFWWNFLEFFFKEQLISTMFTLLWFNTASITFLISQILTIDENNSFEKTKKEIFHNFVGMLVVLIITFIFLSCFNFPDSWVVNNLLNWLFFTFILSLLFFFWYLFYEVLYAIIFISKNK